MQLQSGTRGNPEAKILIVGESYNSSDENAGRAFEGNVGKELDNILLEAGIQPGDCYYTNVVNKRPYGNNLANFCVPFKEARKVGVKCVRGLYPDVPLLEGVMLLEELIQQLQPTLIIAFGNYALWALTEDSFRVTNGSKKYGTAGHKIPTGIVDYRGSQLRSRFGDIPVLPTFHPATTFRNQAWRYLCVHDIRSRSPKAFASGKWSEPERNYIIRPSLDQALSILNNLTLRASMSATPLLLAADIETVKPHMDCIGFAWNEREAMCVPLMCSDKWEGYWTAQEEVLVMQAIKELLEHRNVEVVGQNFFYDIQYLYWYWVMKPNYKQDTMLAHHLCFPGTTNNLNYISSLYCDFHQYWKEDGKDALAAHNDEQRWIYNCRDCVVTYEAITELWKVIKHYKLEEQYCFQMHRANSAVDIMTHGVAINEKRRAEEWEKHLATMMEYQSYFEYSLPESAHPRAKKKAAWFASPAQLCEIFYDKLGQTPIKNRDTGNLTANDDALMKIGMREPLLRPLTTKLREYNSYVAFEQFLTMKTGRDGRMRTSLSPTAETFRYRSGQDAFGSGRNLQNLPKGNEDE